jgi:hypothetical protein
MKSAKKKDKTLSMTTKTSRIYLDHWAKIVNGRDLQKSLIKHFKFLSDTYGYEDLLVLLMKEATRAEIKNDTLVVEFGKKDKLIALPPTKDQHKEWPDSFRKIISQHEEIRLEKAQISLGTRGSFEPEFLEESEWAEKLNTKNVLSPISEHADWWIYNPRKKNKTKQPTLHFLSHEEEEPGEGEEVNVGTLFLQRVANALGIDAKPVATSRDASGSADKLPWWKMKLEANRKNLISTKLTGLISLKGQRISKTFLKCQASLGLG